MSEVLPMFPLSVVLFPHVLMPLHIFEPRYRALVADCLAGGGEFGVVLIERGSEVGGGDTRFGVGTAATILRSQSFPDGRILVVVGGTQRLRVKTWLIDDPYPQAEIERLTDQPSLNAGDRVPEILELAHRVIARRVELGEAAAGPGIERVLDDEPARMSYRIAAAAGLGPLDAQELLELDDTAARFERLEELLTDAAALLEFRLDRPPGSTA